MANNLSPENDIFISLEEAGKLLGVHPRTVYRACMNRTFTYRKTPGGWTRVSRNDILASQAPVQHIEQEAE